MRFLKYWKIRTWKAILLFWKLRNRDFVLISWNFLKEKTNFAKSSRFFFVFFSKIYWCEICLSLFSRTGLPSFSFFFFFFLICVICLLHASWVLFLQQKIVYCVLTFWLICVMIRSYMLMLIFIVIPLIFFQNNMSSHSVRFPSGVLNLRSKV